LPIQDDGEIDECRGDSRRAGPRRIEHRHGPPLGRLGFGRTSAQVLRPRDLGADECRERVGFAETREESPDDTSLGPPLPGGGSVESPIVGSWNATSVIIDGTDQVPR
jgi:hypothetical protein